MAGSVAYIFFTNVLYTSLYVYALVMYSRDIRSGTATDACGALEYRRCYRLLDENGFERIVMRLASNILMHSDRLPCTSNAIQTISIIRIMNIVITRFTISLLLQNCRGKAGKF